MSGRVRAGAIALGVIGTLALPQVAGARPWTAEYDWQAGSRTGYENWVAEESVPGSGQPLPFYRTYLGGAPAQIGRGLAIAPLGGRIYDNGDPASQTGGPGLIFRWAVPGASRITTARFDDVRYRNANDGQYLRLRLAGPGGHRDADLGPDFNEEEANTTYSRGPYTHTVPGGGTSAELWMFTVCGSAPQGEPGPYRCPTIASSTPTFGRLGSVRLTLDDPDQPALVVDASPAIDDGWVNKRRTQRLQITAADPSSGIQRIRVQVRAGTSGTGGRTLKTQTVACDPDHTTPGRAGLVCPVTAGTSAVDPAGNQTGSDRTYVVTATDYAGNERSQSFTVRRDVQAPTGGSVSGGELRKLTDGWTNREGTVPVRLRGQDSRSGVARLQLFARRVASGRATELADTAVTCTGSCQASSEVTNATLDRSTLPRDGRYRLEVRVTDRAGNSKVFRTGESLKIDREAPRRLGPQGQATLLPNGSLRLRFSPGRDAGESSGLGNVVVRYWPAQPYELNTLDDGDELFDDSPSADEPQPAPARARTAPRIASARIVDLPSPKDAGPRVRRLQRSITIPNVGELDTSRPVEVYVYDRARGALVDPSLPGWSGNRRADLIPIAGGSTGPGQALPAKPSSNLPGPPRAGSGDAGPLEQTPRGDRLPADFSPNGTGPSRGRSPAPKDDDIKTKRDDGGKDMRPWDYPPSVQEDYGLYDRKLANIQPRVKPWPLEDTWPRDGLAAQAARVRGINKRSMSFVKKGQPYFSITQVNKSMGRRIPLYGDQAEDRNGKRLPVYKDNSQGKCAPLFASHIVGAVFGAWGDDLRNFVPLTRGDNIGMRTAFETFYRDVVENNSEAKFTYYVHVRYHDRTKLYPKSISGSLDLVEGKITARDPKTDKPYQQHYVRTYLTKDGRSLQPAGSCKPK
ncbi:Ig-like domain repeat protein [Patulibacter sp. SYSU D01012]|uniref:Ig-like domain repeat protein n=1 Tax=Patulibacter sp. SYSU D01012 TaxID=2817381 RepID=UPI001B316112|nr:Ig-like domain repeat protein [Patulibacter sp. SYSU D01012]